MATTVTIPTTADLPKDWKTTLIGLLMAITGLVGQYVKLGQVTWYGAAACVLIAVIFYFLQKAVVLSPAAELDIEQKVEKLVADALAKQPVFPDAEALAAQVITTVQQSLASPPQAAAAPAAPVAPAPEAVAS